MAAVCLALLVGARAAGWPWQTIAFTTLALLQLGHALVVRSERESFFTLGARSNPFLLAAVLGAVAVQLAILRRLRRGGAREVDHPPAVPKVPPDTGLMALLHGPRFEQAVSWAGEVRPPSGGDDRDRGCRGPDPTGAATGYRG